MLTGESLGTEAGSGYQTFAGALVRRGEAVAQVTATGIPTKFGRTAELMRTARVVSSPQKAGLHVVRKLAKALHDFTGNQRVFIKRVNRA